MPIVAGEAVVGLAPEIRRFVGHDEQVFAVQTPALRCVNPIASGKCHALLAFIRASRPSTSCSAIRLLISLVWSDSRHRCRATMRSFRVQSRLSSEDAQGT